MDNGGRKRVAIACQGGGSHTAFTAGALKRLLQDDRYEFVALSGTSGGAICALLAWYALIEHGKGENGASKATSEAARSLEKFWLEDNVAGEPWERMLNDWLVGWLRWQQATGILFESSPNAFSDYWQNQLRLTLEKNITFENINEQKVRPASPKLFVGAVNVLTGEFKVFGSHKREDGANDPDGRPSWVFNDKDGIGVDAFLASAVIPPIFRSVPIGEGVYWDGLFSQNPPVRELLETRPDEVWVIQINPNSLAPRSRHPVPGDEPTSVVVLGAPPLRQLRSSYEGEQEIRDFVRERLAADIRIDPTKKQVTGDAVTWTVRISPRLSKEVGSEADDDPAEGSAEAVFEEGKIRTLTFVPSE